MEDWKIVKNELIKEMKECKCKEEVAKVLNDYTLANIKALFMAQGLAWEKGVMS